jgi:ParB family chromosome partitioning protein
LTSIPIDKIVDNPFNCRQFYKEDEIKTLAKSLSRIGLQNPIKVRKQIENYELVYGHRRVRAAKILGWKSINAEIVNLADEEMLQLSLEENLLRKDLSDFEKGLSFQRLASEFGKTYEEIGNIVGYTRAHVCNYIRMVNLFDKSFLSKNPNVFSALNEISEHHARILGQIDDVEDRAMALRLIVSDNLSVRETQKVIQKFRSWFENRSSNWQGESLNQANLRENSTKSDRSHDLKKIHHVLSALFELPHKRDFKSFEDLHAFQTGFSVFSNFPPLERFDNENAYQKEKQWFYTIAPSLTAHIKDARVQFFERTALATLYVVYKGSLEGEEVLMTVRGTVLFRNDSGSWKIIHEHWSRLNVQNNLITTSPNAAVLVQAKKKV